MIAPGLISGMIQNDDLTGFGIDAREIRPFVQITVLTGQREVVFIVAAVVLLRDDVFNVQTDGGRLSLLQSAVLTGVARAVANPLTQIGIHYDASRCERV